MLNLTELSGELHYNLHVLPDVVIDHLAQQHVMSLSVLEVPQAATAYPIFLSRNEQDGRWGCAAVTSFVPGHNLFIQDKTWQPVYQPNQAKTYPLYLMHKGESFCVGIDPNSPAFSTEAGKALFTSPGEASQHLSQVSQLLQNSVPAIYQTDEFCSYLEANQLLKGIDLQVIDQSGSANKITGLYTIDEDQLKALSHDALYDLSKRGYLAPIYAILMSIFQINALVSRHNLVFDNHIANVKVEVSKDPNQF